MYSLIAFNGTYFFINLLLKFGLYIKFYALHDQQMCVSGSVYRAWCGLIRELIQLPII